MTINSEVRVSGPYTGNGSTTAFPFAFKVFSADEVLVVSETAGVETVLVLGSDYTVALNPDQDASPGGTVTLTAPLATGKRLTLTSALEYLQPVDLTNQGGFYPRVINNAFDRLTILQQQLFERLSRALVFPISDGGVGEIPGGSARAGAVLAFDESGDPVVGPSIAAVGSVAANVGVISTVANSIADVNTVAGNITDVTNFADVYYGPSPTDPTVRRDGSPLQKGDLYFSTTAGSLRAYDGTRWAAAASGSISTTTLSGTGVQTAFTLPSAPGEKTNTQVYISGVYQQKSGYGVSGTTLTFNVAPPTGVNNIEVVAITPLPVDPLTTEDIVDLIALRAEAVRKTGTTGAAVLPSGTDAQRPGAPSNGMLRYNSQTNQFEGYQNGTWAPVGGGAPLFSVMWWPQRSAIPAGYVAADGQLLSRASYPDAWSGIQAGSVPTVADATWGGTPTERGKFTVGNGTTTFRLPDYNGKAAGSLGAVFLRGDGTLSAGTAGVIQQDEIRSHTHGFGVGTTDGTAGVADSSSAPMGMLSTDNFGGAETRPLNVTGCWVIKLFGAAVNVGTADASQLASDYANLASRVSSLENKGAQLPAIQPGNWVSKPNSSGGGTVTAGSQGYLFFTPVMLPSCTVMALGALVSTAVASREIRLGIYANSGGFPGALLQDFGTASTATTGPKEVPGVRGLAEGLYWLAFATSATTTAAFAAAQGDGSLGAQAIGAAPRAGYASDFVYGTLPSVAPAILPGYVGLIPYIAAKIN